MRRLSKTQIDSFDRCERYGYLKYFYLGHGIEANVLKSSDLSVGVGVHMGVEMLFAGKSIADAVEGAHLEYLADLNGSFDKVPPEVRAAITLEQSRAIEGTLRLWQKVRLPALLADYEFFASEYKVETQITETLSLYARPDAILKSKMDSRYFNWSLKTEKAHSRIKHPSALIDTGGLTESISMAVTVGNGDLKDIGGTLMEYLVIGKMDDDEPIIWNPLLHGWRRFISCEDENDPRHNTYEYAWRWTYPNPDYDPNGPKSTYKNPKSRSLKKDDGWERFNSWDYPGGMDKWIDALVANQFTPTHVNPLSELIFTPEPYTRTASKIESFLVQTIATQGPVEENAQLVNAGIKSLDEAFPQRRPNCLRYGEDYRCEFWNICWEGISEPLSQGYRLKKRRAEGPSQETK